MANTSFGPASVVNRLVGLYGSDHIQLRETSKVFLRHVLRVLDAEAALHPAIGSDHVGIQIKNSRDSAIADGMGAQLQSGGVGLRHPIAHPGEWLHLLAQQTGVAGIVTVWVKEVCGAGTQ